MKTTLPPDRTKNIVLVGMPGAGKSTVGVLLAKYTTREFVDSDVLIQVRESQSLQEILDGSDYLNLRRIEQEVRLIDGRLAAEGMAQHPVFLKPEDMPQFPEERIDRREIGDRELVIGEILDDRKRPSPGILGPPLELRRCDGHWITRRFFPSGFCTRPIRQAAVTPAS